MKLKKLFARSGKMPNNGTVSPTTKKTQPPAKEDACHRCGRRLLGLPYTCRYCGLDFCVEHRLPESHLCTGSFRRTPDPVVALPVTLPEIIPALEKLVAIARDKTWLDVDTDSINEADERLLDRAAELVDLQLAGGSPRAGTFDLWFNAGKVAQRFRLASKAAVFYQAALAIPAASSGIPPETAFNLARAEVLAYLGQSLLYQHKKVEAEDAFHSARALAPTEAEQWIALDNEEVSAWVSGSGQTYLTYHPHDLLVISHPEVVYQERVSRDPKDAGAFFALAQIWWLKSLLGEAERYLRVGLKIKPDAASMWNSLGCILADGGKFRMAEEAFKTSIHIDPQCPDTHYNLGLLLEANHRDEAAISEFRLCTKLFPGDARPWVHLGMLLRHAGKDDDAEGAFRHATRLDPWLETELPRVLDYLASRRPYHNPGNLYV